MISRTLRQELVLDWVTRAFGPDHANSKQQLVVRFLEEAIELYQACGADRGMAHKLIDYIFDRSPGYVNREVGQVGLTLLAVAEAIGISADLAEEDEISRVLSKDPAEFAERNRQKNEAGFDTGAYSKVGAGR